MKLLEKLKGVKHGEWMLLVAAVGLALALMAGGLGGGADGETPDSEETRLAAVLSRIAGAGRVEVYISTETATEEAVYTFSVQEGTSGARVTGVIIVAEGAGDPAVNIRLAEAARTALGLNASQVSVYVMER